MEQRRRQTSVEQLTLLVEYLEQHKDLALGRVRSKEARALTSRLWRECSLILNSEGPSRTDKEWAKVWNDLKSRVRAKLVAINASHQATGGGPSTAAPLTPLEERIGNILGRDIGPLPNVRQDPFASHSVISNEENVIEELIVGDQIEQLDSQLQIEPAVHAQDAHLSPVHESAAHESAALSPTPSVTGQVPPSPSRSGDRNRLRRQRQRDQRAAARPAVPLSPPPPAQSNRTALEESRTMVLRIENMRAEAALINAQANRIWSEGFKLLAESIDRFTRQYALREAEAPPSRDTENR